MSPGSPRPLMAERGVEEIVLNGTDIGRVVVPPDELEVHPPFDGFEREGERDTR